MTTRRRPQLDPLEPRRLLTLDPTFGTGGMAHFDFSNGSRDHAIDVAIQEDPGAPGHPKSVIVGVTYPGRWGTFDDSASFVARVDDDGTLDAGFGSGGRVILDLSGGDDQFRAVAVDPSSRAIYAAGSLPSGKSGTDLTLVRFLPDGAVDASFGRKGIAKLNIGQHDGPSSVTVLRDGRLLVAGSTSGGGAEAGFVAIVTASGALDRSFSGDGIATINPGTSTTFDDVAVTYAADGGLAAITATGRVFDGGMYSIVLVQFDAIGNLKPSFGQRPDGSPGGGVVLTNVSGLFHAGKGVAIDGAGRVLVAADLEFEPGLYEAGVLAYTADGRLDASFAPGEVAGVAGGVKRFGVAMEGAADIAIDAHGRIVVGGSRRRMEPGSDGTPDVVEFNMATARLLPTGAPDAAFDGDGFAYANFADLTPDPADRVPVGIGAIALAGDTILASGSVDTFGGGDAALSRFVNEPPVAANGSPAVSSTPTHEATFAAALIWATSDGYSLGDLSWVGLPAGKRRGWLHEAFRVIAESTDR